MAVPPWEMDWSRPGGANPGPFSVDADPILAQRAREEEERKRQDQILEQQAAARAAAAAAIDQDKAARERQEWLATHNPDGSPKTQTSGDDRVRDAQTLRMLVDEYERVAAPYMGQTTGGEVWAQVNPFDRLNTEGVRARETTAQNILPLIRRLMRTPGDPQAQLETGAYDKFLPSVTATDDENKRRVKVLRELANQIDPQGAVAAETPRGAGRDELPAAMGAAMPGGGPPAGPAPGSYGSARPTPPMLSPGDPRYGAGDQTRTVNNPELEAEYRRRLASQSDADILNWLQSQNVGPQTIFQAMEQLKYRREHPEVPADRYSITSNREVPLSALEQGATALGSGAAGAYTLGAAQFLTGNTLDNMAGDPERARLALDIGRTAYPNATMAGEISGGVMGSLAGEAALARLGMAPGFLRGIAADASMGAANGAGAADSGNRLLGAGQGALAAGVGNVGGTVAARGIARGLSPTGGKLADLYASGVRPTPGQRFADSGMIGRAVNATEEAFQSVPVVGSAIRGARQNARDQFQIGAWNEALSEVGEALPKGMKPGNDPHAYAQNVFRRVYNQARAGMTMVADEELSNELGQLAPDIATLGPASQKKLKAILANTVNNKVKAGGGTLSGKAYQAALSDLGKHTARLRNSPMAEDQALADVLQGVEGALTNAARRHSDPAAVQLLDAADAGYAKLVRIEEAAARRGGEAGTFSPNAFDSAVQRSSGGVRSKAYLRGDALMQDYASAGKALEDRLPNSGTADRLMIGGGTVVPALAAYAEPSTLAILGAIGAAYAPGVRRATTGVFAPSGPKAKMIARQLEKRARLLGRLGAASGAAALPGMAPSQ